MHVWKCELRFCVTEQKITQLCLIYPAEGRKRDLSLTVFI